MQTGYLRRLLGKNEQVILIAHQHWLVLFGEILSESVLTVALLVLITLINQLWVPDPRVMFAYLLLIFPLLSLLRDVLIWLNRQYIVTNRRVIQISGVFNKDVTDSSLEKVNDVKLEQSILGRVFDYGDIEILTASELGVNLFRRIGSPIRFKTAMLDAKDRLGDAPAGASERSLKPDIPTMIAQLDSLRKQGVITEAEFNQKKAELLAKL